MAEPKRRIPPGQFITEKFPVLTYGPVPKIDPARWAFRVYGLVAHPLTLSYKELTALPRIKVVADMHCVTRWSRLNNEWEGIGFREIVKLAQPLREARFVTAHCEGGYTTNLPLDALLDDDVLLAFRHDGQDLTPDHGWPLRLVVPKRYAWKSAKWLTGLEFTKEDLPGFWEREGYHNNGDPWKEATSRDQTFLDSLG